MLGAWLGQIGWVETLGLYALPMSGSTLLAWGLYQVARDFQKSDEKRIEQRLRGGAAAKRREQLIRESLLRQRHRGGSSLSAVLGRWSFVPTMQRAIDQANLPWSAQTLLMYLGGLSFLGFAGVYAAQQGVWWALLTATLLAAGPLMYVHVLRRVRMNRMLNQLPDVFELMSQGLRAGHSLANSINLVAEQLPDPAGTEFARVFHEQNLGLKIEDALLNMAKRVDMMDVRFFVTAVLIQRTTGGDLAEVLDNISTVIRERIKLFGQVKALTAEGRLSGYVLFALPFVVFAAMQVVSPEYARILIDDPLGNQMLVGAFVMQMLGLAMIKKIVNIKV
jgi:tight adherence protein B